MVIISKSTLNKFGNEHPESKDALLNWYQITKVADWRNYHELKNSFNTTDAVGNDRYVFNIKGNHYRLIVRMNYAYQIVWIRFIGTHAQYDKIDATKI